MKLTAARCPACAANIQLPEGRGRYFCQYCGTQIIIEEECGINIGAVKIDRTDELNNLLIRAKRLHSAGRYDDAEKYYNRVLDIDATNDEALTALSRIERAIVSPNLIIERGNTRGSGEARTVLIVDGVKCSADLDCSVSITLSEGVHQVEFKRGPMVGSMPVSITINNRYDRYRVVFTPKLLTISVNMQKI